MDILTMSHGRPANFLVKLAIFWSGANQSFMRYLVCIGLQRGGIYVQGNDY